MVSHMLSPCLKAFRCLMPFAVLTLLEGATLLLSRYIEANGNCSRRDVTDHLQLLLRKAGHHLHTSAEKEVVRTIKEKCCYVAANPQKEEKDTRGRTEEFHLPDGSTIQVGIFTITSNGRSDVHISWARNASWLRRFFSILRQ